MGNMNSKTDIKAQIVSEGQSLERIRTHINELYAEIDELEAKDEVCWETLRMLEQRLAKATED